MTTAYSERAEMDAATGELDLEDRHALRRVAGLSTELTDITEVEYRALRLERVVLIGVWTEGTLQNAENQLEEMITRDHNRASLIIYSIANETPISVAATNSDGRPGTANAAPAPSARPQEPTSIGLRTPIRSVSRPEGIANSAGSNA